MVYRTFLWSSLQNYLLSENVLLRKNFWKIGFPSIICHLNFAGHSIIQHKNTTRMLAENRGFIEFSFFFRNTFYSLCIDPLFFSTLHWIAHFVYFCTNVPKRNTNVLCFYWKIFSKQMGTFRYTLFLYITESFLKANWDSLRDAQEILR